MLHYFTIATLHHPNLEAIQEVAAKNGDTLHVLGTHEGVFKRDIFGFKLRYLKDFLSQWPDDHIVLYTDAYDVILNGTLEMVKGRFLATGARVLFAAERGCWPDSFRTFQYKTHGRDFPYLNAGAFIGYVADLKRLLEGHDIVESEDDQRFWTSQYLEGKGIALDHENRIFFCGFQVRPTDFSVKDGMFYYKNTDPLILHFNGDSKEQMYGLWKNIRETQ